MKFYRQLGLFAATICLMLVPSISRATAILDESWTTNVQCGGDCFGSTYRLIIDDGGTNDRNFSARLIVDASSYVPPAGKSDYKFISAVDFKVSSNVSSASLTSAPTLTGGWSVAINNGQASGDCSGSGNGFICARDSGTNNLAPVPNALPYEWDFNFALPSGSNNSNIDFGHLGVRYCKSDDDECTGVIVSISEDGSTPPPPRVPEPSTFLLLGTGLVGLSIFARSRLRRRQKQSTSETAH